MSSFGERLAYLRNQRRLSQAELARLLNLGQSTIAMYEKNKRSPDHHSLIRLANFFGVSTDYLLGRIDQPHANEHGKGQRPPLDEKLWSVVTDPLFADLLRQVSDLAGEEKQSLAEYWELALQYVRRRKGRYQERN
jgi:transcriptional regulator with XRE-family HTH domain